MARSAVDSLRHWRYPELSNKFPSSIRVLSGSTLTTDSKDGTLSPYSSKALMHRLFKHSLQRKQNRVQRCNNYSKCSLFSLPLNSWNHSHKALRETTELCFTNQQNTDAMVDIYVVRSIHPLTSPATTLLLLNRESHSVTTIFDNASGTYRPYDNTATANVEPQYNIFNAAALWKHFQLVETRHFRVKAGAHYTSASAAPMST